MGPTEGKRKYISAVNPSEIMTVSQWKIPGAKERLKQHKIERQRRMREGLGPEREITYRKEVMERGQSRTALETARDTARTTRKIPLRHSENREIKRAGTEFAQESASQVWNNFMNQSVRTATLVRGLFERFTTDILASRPAENIPPAVYDNESFIAAFKSLRNTADYVELIQKEGYGFALSNGQARQLGELLELPRKRVDRIVSIVKELENQLNNLCQQARVEGFDGKTLLLY